MKYYILTMLLLYSSVFYAQNDSTNSITETDDSRLFYVVEHAPEFPGGEDAMINFINLNRKYPDSALLAKIEGRVTLGFVVDKEGNISHIEVKKSVHPLLDAEALRIVRMFPKMKPGVDRGEMVKVLYVLPIVFRLSGGVPLQETRAAFDLSQVQYKENMAQRPNIFQVVDRMPEFVGGDDALINFLHEHIQYPDSARIKGVTGRVLVGFIVNEDGSLSDIALRKSLDPLLDAEALRVVKKFPRFYPGLQKGKPVRVSYVLPIVFKLPNVYSQK